MELRKYVSDLAAKATTRILGRAIDPKEHEQLIMRALEEDA